LPEKKHLFLKNISDHSIGAYKELCKGIGVAFEAIPVNATTGTGLEDHVQDVLISAEVCKQLEFLDPANHLTQPTQVSFSTKIDELRGENAKLEQELKQWRDQATEESRLRQQSEEELNKLKIAYQILQQDFQKSVVMAGCFKSDIYKSTGIVNRIMPLLEELSADLTLNEHLLVPIIN
jgi:hypothetical protein